MGHSGDRQQGNKEGHQLQIFHKQNSLFRIIGQRLKFGGVFYTSSQSGVKSVIQMPKGFFIGGFNKGGGIKKGDTSMGTSPWHAMKATSDGVITTIS
jgi:hypothetical protein